MVQITGGTGYNWSAQGLVLGPTLFLTFINDLPECVSSGCRLFADDSIIYRPRRISIDLTGWEERWG